MSIKKDFQLSSDGWTFLAHSHRDIIRVREIRNELEKNHRNPLIFFLKCLDDDDAMLPELLRKEIEAREWFILCDSENAQASKWVQEEVRIIKSDPDKVFTTINLDAKELDLSGITRLCNRATVYISHSHEKEDNWFARKIAGFLERRDFSVFLDIVDLSGGDNWERKISDSLHEAARSGFLLVILTQNWLASKGANYDVKAFLEQSHQSGNIVPVLMEERPTFPIPQIFRQTRIFIVREKALEEDMTWLIRHLKTVPMR